MVIALTATAGLIVVLLAAGSWRQSRIWQSSEALWRWAVVTDPSCAICLHNLGSTLVNSPQSDPNRLREAEGHLRDSIRLRPERAGSYQALARKPDLSDVRADLVTALDKRAEELERAGQAGQAEQLRKAAGDVRAQAS